MSDTLENIVVVLSVGRTGLARDLPDGGKHPAFWPVGNMTAIENLVAEFADQGINHFVITHSRLHADMLKKMHFKAPDITCIENELPRGSAGCIKNALNIRPGKTAVFMPANCINQPDLPGLLNEHENCESILSLFKNRDRNGQCILPLFICEPEIAKYIPDEGYYDVKEWLISELVKADEKTALVNKDISLGHFRDVSDYHKALLHAVQNPDILPRSIKAYVKSENQDIWTGNNVSIDPTVRIVPPVVIASGSSIGPDAVIIGPSIVGNNCSIGKKTSISGSVIADNTDISAKCTIIDSALLTGKTVRSDIKNNKTAAVPTYIKKKTAGSKEPQYGFSPGFIAASIILFIAFIWSYYNPTVKDLFTIWTNSDEYSSGLLVPLLAGYIFWSRRKSISKLKIKPAFFSGIVLFLAAQAIRFLGLYYMFGSAERLSLIISMYAVILLVTGWKFCWKNKSILLFLLLMLPFPHRVQMAITGPLQHWATTSAVFGLEMLGYDVTRAGNVINVNGTLVAVAEACNGLRMLMAFIVISGLMALVMNRKWWEKLIILVSSIPIALACNTIRLVITSIAFTIIDAAEWEKAFHDFGGYAMMPVAIGMILLELWFLSALFIDNRPRPVQEHVISRKK